MNAIELTGLSKSFGPVKAVDQVSVRFEENKIYGLLGRNGAGKTTMLKMICGMLIPDSGEVQVDGQKAFENDSALQKMFFMGEKNYFPDDMKVKKTFYWCKQFRPEFDMEYAQTLCDSFGLNKNKKIKSLSTGYASIFKIVIALASNVEYLLLDEPVLGLDANHRDMFYRLLLEKYSEKPFTAIISTHLIEEVANVIEHVVIIKEGSIIRDESRDEMLQSGYTVSGKASVIEEYVQGRDVLGIDSLGGLKTACISGSYTPSEIPGELEVTKMDLQRLFIQLTNS